MVFLWGEDGGGHSHEGGRGPSRALFLCFPEWIHEWIHKLIHERIHDEDARCCGSAAAL